MTEPFDDKMLDAMTESPDLKELLDSVKPMCEVGRRDGTKRTRCPAEAVYLIGYQCVLHHGDKVIRVAFCTGHRNQLNNIVDELTRHGHPYRVVFEELLT